MTSISFKSVELPNKPLLSAKEMLPSLPFKRTTLWCWVKQKRFPHPVKVNTLTRWRYEDVRAWLDQFAPQEQSNV